MKRFILNRSNYAVFIILIVKIVEFARYGFLTLTDGVLKTLNEKFVESKLPVKKALKYLVCAGHSYVSLKKRLSKTKNDANLEQNAQNLDNHCGFEPIIYLGFVSREINGPVDFGPINY